MTQYRLGDRQRHSRRHRPLEDDLLEVLALTGGGLNLANLGDHRVDVLGEFALVEAHLADDGVDIASWRHSLSTDSPWSLGTSDGLRILRPGVAQGRLSGGCLSIFAEALGTPYAPRIDADSILFLEDIGTKPYQWDRMLLHLRYSGLLEKVTGIVFGDMRQCVTADENDYLDRALLYALRDFDGPIAIGLRCGHVSASNVTLPLGIAATLDLTEAGNPQMHLLESAVTV